ncbi:helix-turn-helix domain-containing protein [Brevibacillus composti]|uniref:Helix-turn-helix domain-containing protein n=1 Tax=Brevibacillus composti TaxID=2796470 RepID=A0A7T5EN89_9BACL|nr:helix-turn-helix domain-containing protein [Brevibacillus composti]QQE75686.1 helix-turn-helix domain-containing protein [Brevibacillus composti]QUO42712.1 helix-turn-helix domain-containing protein [Brevibacillus composti]
MDTEIRCSNDLPAILTAKHIAQFLHISERRAYELMNLKSFPLIRLGRNKRVNRESFMNWLQQNERRE